MDDLREDDKLIEQLFFSAHSYVDLDTGEAIVVSIDEWSAKAKKLLKARDSKRDAEILDEPSTDWYKEQLRLSIKKFDEATSQMQEATESMKSAATLTNKDGDDKGE